MYTITILRITSFAFEGITTLTATFAIANNGTILRWSMGGIDQGENVQALLDSMAADLFAEALAADAPTMTQGQVNAEHYAWIHLEHKDTIYLASYTLETGVFGLAVPVTVTPYKAVLNAALAAMDPITNTPLGAHFRNEIAAQGLPALSPGVGSYTLAQCAAMDNLMRCWFSAFKVNVLIAEGSQ